MTWEGTRVVLATPAGPLALRSPLIGAHNVSNMMAAVAGGLLLSVPPVTVAAGIAATVASRAGGADPERPRAPRVRGLRPHAGRDGPGALDAPGLDGRAARHRVRLRREPRPRKASRDGPVAALRSDVVVATSDNPRNEEPGAILAEIVPGLTSEGFVEARGPAAWREGFFRVEADRKAAIAACPLPRGAGRHGGDRRERTRGCPDHRRPTPAVRRPAGGPGCARRREVG